jgi:hypothetical protein
MSKIKPKGWMTTDAARQNHAEEAGIQVTSNEAAFGDFNAPLGTEEDEVELTTSHLLEEDLSEDD